jgi:hypothetical protein
MLSVFIFVDNQTIREAFFCKFCHFWNFFFQRRRVAGQTRRTSSHSQKVDLFSNNNLENVRSIDCMFVVVFRGKLHRIARAAPPTEKKKKKKKLGVFFGI